jgi:hypothetical protein
MSFALLLEFREQVFWSSILFKYSVEVFHSSILFEYSVQVFRSSIFLKTELGWWEIQSHLNQKLWLIPKNNPSLVFNDLELETWALIFCSCFVIKFCVQVMCLSILVRGSCIFFLSHGFLSELESWPRFVLILFHLS